MTMLTQGHYPTSVRSLHVLLRGLMVVMCAAILGAPAAQAAQDFVILGQEGVWVREGSVVVNGDVGANVASAGPWLASQQEMTIGKTVVVQDPTSQVMGDTMRLKTGSQVQDVSVNTLLGPGLIQGTTTTPVPLPLVDSLPAIPAVTPGTQDHIVPSGDTLTLDAGSYDLVRALPDATIFLSGGTYHIRELNLRNNAKLYALAPVDVRIQDHLNGREAVEVGPAPAATTLTAGDVVITAVGVNGTTGAITASPAAARFGIGSIVRANVYAPNGTVRVWGSSTIMGAFVGKWVRIDAGSTITLEDGFGLGSGGGNTPPVADAGPDQTVQVTDLVQLDGSDSTDVDGDLLTYSWTFLTQPAGSTATLDDPTSVMPTFVADAPGSYEIELIVNDGAADSAPDTVTITTINSPPVADAGPDQTVFVTQNVLLDGTASSDVDQDPLTFQWTFVTTPSGSTATLSDPTDPMPNFTVDLPGVYSVQLIVHDGTEASAPDLVIIDTQNSKPVAVAEPDQTVPIGSTVQLDGSQSNDVDGDPLTYLWALLTMPAGSTATLSDVTAVQPTFVADLAGIYVVQLIVNDGQEDSDPATVTITTANTPPVAEAGPDQTVPVGSTVQLDGSASSDADGDPLTYQWTLTSQPAGSTATLSDVTLVNPTLVADVAGSYVVTLVVNDGTEDSAADAVLITTDNLAPVANAGPDQTVALGATVQLDGSASSDPDNNPLTYAWTVVTAPAGSAATLANATLVTPTLTADQPGAYVVQLIVNDGTVDSPPDTVVITVSNPAPTLDPVGNQSVVLGQTLVVTLSGSDPNGDPLQFGISTAPVPANLTLNGSTGELLFHPDGTQVGAHVLTFFVSDGASADEETVTITVQGPGPGSSTAIQGRILDTNAFVSTGTEIPVVGATVSFLGTGLSTTSDAQGTFTLSGLPSGVQVFNIDATTAQAGPNGETYASFREQLTLTANVTNVHDRPFYLPHVDPNSQMTVNGTPVTQIDPNNTTVVTNPALGVSLTVPPHTAFLNGQEYAGTLTISEVPEALAPAALPDTLEPGLLITVQPPGVTFATPTAITFPNVDALDVGTQANIWSLDPLKGRFVIVGTLEVSADGSTLVTSEGGIKNTDWICPCPPAPNGGPSPLAPGFGIGPNDGAPPGSQPSGPNPGGGNPGTGGENGGGDGGGEDGGEDKDKEKEKDCNSTPSGSSTSLCGGELEINHSLTPYRSLGKSRGPRFWYRHLNAAPQPILFNNPVIPFLTAMPQLMSAELEVAGVSQGAAVYTDTGAVTGRTGDYSLRQAVQFDAQHLATGNYPYRLRLTNHYLESAIGTVIQDTVLVRNERDSVFGAGWTLEGLDRLDLQSNGDAVVNLGNGGQLLFRNRAPGIFTETQSTVIPTGIIFPRRPIVGDFDEDGQLDTAVPGQTGLNGRWSIYLGQGDASLVLANEVVGGARPDAVNQGDFNEDGHLDLIAVSEFSDGAIINFGRGDGTFGDATGTPDGVNWTEMTLPLVQYNSLVVEDFNGDGHLDIAASDNFTKLIVVGHGDGLGNFTLLPSIALTGDGPRGLAAADVNQDGVLDLISVNRTELAWFLADGAGGYAPPVFAPITNLLATEMTTGDFNQDGFPDVAVSSGPVTIGDQILIFENNRLGGFYPQAPFFLPVGSNPVALHADDVTADGLTDLLVVTQGSGGSVTVVPGTGASEFGTARVFPVTGNPSVLAVGDLNASGAPELLVSSNPQSGSGYRINVLRNEDLNDGFFSPPGDFSTLTNNPNGTFTRRLKHGTVIAFNAQGLQTSRTDRNGNTTSYAYDAQDRLATLTDPAGLVTTFDYGGGTHLSTITDPVGRQTQFEINSDGDLVTITDPDFSTRGFTYDPQHRMVQQESKRGFFTQYEYNFAGRHVKATRPDQSTREIAPSEVVGVVDPASGVGTETNPAPVIQPTEVVGTVTDGKGQVAPFKTDALGNPTVRTDALNRTTTISRNFHGDPVVTTHSNTAITRRTYDDQGNVLTLTEAEGLPEEQMTIFEYDPVFNLVTKIIDPATKETTIVRDANGNPERVINPFLDERVRTFTPEGLVETDTDENTATTQFFYDPVTKNLDRIVDAETHTTRFVRDAAGNVTSLIEGEGTPEQRTRTFTYDTMNRLTSATDGTPNPPTQFRYDAQGNLEETELPTGEIEGRTYDPMNRVASIDDPLRGRTTFAYDPNGQLERTVNAANETTTFGYDVAQQLETITDALNGVQVFDYDAEGNVKTFTDARQKTTTFLYDKLNRQTDRISHGGAFTTTFTYDSRDNLEDTTDPNGQLIHRDYDDLSRLTEITTPDNSISIGYDKVGNPTDVMDTDSQVTFTYDGLNRVETALTSQTSGIQPQVLLTSVYDAVGNRTQLDEDTGTSITNYLYDLAGRLTTLTPPPGAAMQVSLGYDPAGRLASIAYPNGVATAYGYDARGRLDSLSHTLGTNPSFADFGYTYNPVGNILDILDQVNPSESRSHSYDVLQRLKTGGTTGNAETYDYDLVGNRTISFLSSTHNHDDLNRLTEDDQFTYTYDNNGNLTTKTDKANPTQVTTYHWDAQDQLVQIDRPDSTTVTYKYDGLGRRIEKTVDGTIMRYVYDGEDILLEYDGTNTFLARYSHGDQVDQPLILQKAGLGFFYYHSNHQGSITHLTDNSGNVANSYVYDSYGRRSQVIESVIQPYSYTGREFDVESGLYFYRARYFDASTGRFLSEDPIRFRGGDQNLYNYVFNSPLNLRDPYGRFPLKPLNPVAQKFAEAIGEAARGTKHFLDMYDAMRQRNRGKNQDKFFHCMANCQATKEGPGGEAAAEVISEVRELTDEFIKGDSRVQCDADRAANEKGQETAKKGGDCNKECSTLSPGIVFPP